MIGHLTPLVPDPNRSAAVTARCHERLARHRRKIERRTNGVIERNFAAGIALIYFAAVAIRALSVFSTF